MRIMKRVFIVFLALFVLTGCVPRNDVALTYAGKDIECEIAYALGDMNVRGIFVSHKTESGKDVEFAFLEPQALCGITVQRVGGVISAEIDGIEICGEQFACWLGVEALFESEGEIIESSLAELGTERLNRIVLATEEEDRLEIFLSGDSDTPVMICGKVNGEYVRGNVIRFDAK